MALFQIRGPAAPKLLSPKLLCVRGTAHMLSSYNLHFYFYTHLLHLAVKALDQCFFYPTFEYENDKCFQMANLAESTP